jgi:ABC-type transporter Mla subunit MlaD
MTNEEWMEFLKESIASHDRQLGELTDKLNSLTDRVNAQTANIDKLVGMSNRDAVDIAALARIAESHENRISDLEGGQQS